MELFGPGQVASQKELSVPGLENLILILQSTSATLIIARKAISDSGQLQSMTDVDSLLAVAQIEIRRSLIAALR
jgi:hypothetical protein